MKASTSRVYLLDTHAIVWAIGAPEHLSAKTRDIIESGQAIVSAVSLWELIVKSTRKDAPVVPTEWWERYIGRQGIQVLPIRVKHLQHLELLANIHKDPFDRLLICQAVTERNPNNPEHRGAGQVLYNGGAG